MRRFAVALACVLLVVGCDSGSPTTSKHSPRRALTAITRGQRVGWHSMAYLASNPTFVSIEIQTKAPAGVVIGDPTTVTVNAYPLAKPVWVSITSTRLTVHARNGGGVMKVATQGCPAQGPCDQRPLYALTGTPIPHAPPGGVVTRQGFGLHIATQRVQPGRYDFALPIRYPSSEAHPALLDTADMLHVRLDVDAKSPPPTVCTPRDLRLAPAVIPAGHVLADTIALEGGSTRLDPPPRGYRPRLSSARARQLLSHGRARGGGDATLVLASLSEMQSGVLPALPTRLGGAVGKVKLGLRPHDVVAWVLYTQHVAINANEISTPAPRPGSSTAPSNACFFLDGLNAINATTGAQIHSSGGSASPDLIHF